MKTLKQLDQLNLDPATKAKVAELFQSLLEQAQKDADKVIHAKDLKIQSLILELAHLQQSPDDLIKTGSESSKRKLSGLKQSLFKKSNSQDPAALQTRAEPNGKPALPPQAATKPISPIITYGSMLASGLLIWALINLFVERLADPHWLSTPSFLGSIGATGLLITVCALLAIKRRRATLAALSASLPKQQTHPINAEQTFESTAELAAPAQQSIPVLVEDSQALAPVVQPAAVTATSEITSFGLIADESAQSIQHPEPVISTPVAEPQSNALEFSVDVPSEPTFAASVADSGLSFASTELANDEPPAELDMDISSLTGHGANASPDHESTRAMTGFPHPGPLPKGEGDQVAATYTVTMAQPAAHVSEFVAEPAHQDMGLTAAPIEEDNQGLSFDMSGFDAPATAPEVKPVAADNEPALEFDLSNVTDGAFSFAGVVQTVNTPEPPVIEDKGRTMEFDLTPLTPPSVAQPAPAPIAEEMAELDLSSTPEAAVELTPQAPEIPAEEPKPEPVPDKKLMMEIEAKLDLAKMFIDMDNPAVAKPMLKEVIELGNARQKQDAQELLSTIK